MSADDAGDPPDPTGHGHAHDHRTAVPVHGGRRTRGRRRGRSGVRIRRITPRADTRWWPTLATALLIVIPWLMPIPGTAPIAILVTVLAVPLLVVIVIADPGKVDVESRALRRMTVALTFVLVAAAGLATARLVDELLQGAPNLDNARTLLWAGLLVWVDVIVTFALLYWEIDGGGPAQRLHHPPEYPALAFPQHMNEALAPPGWAPTFPDYLYLGLTNAVAFSPTDVMPLQRWAKLAMGIQSLVSLVILSLIVANAVNLMGS